MSAAPDRERSSAGHAVARQNDFHQANSHQTSNHQANSHTIVKKARVKKVEDEGVPFYKEIDAEISECGESSGPEFPDFNARRVATTIDSDLLASMAACFCKVFDGEFSQVPTMTLRNVITEEVNSSSSFSFSASKSSNQSKMSGIGMPLFIDIFVLISECLIYLLSFFLFFLILLFYLSTSS